MRMAASWFGSNRAHRIQVRGAIRRAQGGLPSDHLLQAADLVCDTAALKKREVRLENT